MIQYVVGDATYPQGDGGKYIVHIVNNEGKWGRGFVVALSGRWQEPEQRYREWCRKKNDERWGEFQLGNVQFVPVQNDITVVNMVAQDGVSPTPHDGRVRVKYWALEQCLLHVAREAMRDRRSVHMPRIGAGLGAGKWELVEEIVWSTLAGLPVFVYDLK